MNRINMGRVLIGGLLAGLIINTGEFILNTVLLAEEMNAAMAALNRPPVDDTMIMWFVLFGFGLGVMLVWVYAAIRPRFGAGIKTAVCASALVWGLAYLYPNLFFIITELFPRGMIVLATIWGLVEVTIAGIAGAWVYTEAKA
jgi:pimeloyl-ACP methyl ester carboxylesterase